MSGNLHHRRLRNGGVYLAVLGSAMVASVLAFSALTLQRVQNRQLGLAADIRQAQLNAEAAIELGLLTIKENSNWRTVYANTSAPWFTRATGSGTCQLIVTDPVDGNLTNDPLQPFLLTGIGAVGSAEQRVELYVEPSAQASDVVRAATQAGGSLSGQSATVDWNAVVATYQNAGTQINVNSLPSRNANLAQNESITDNSNYWTDANNVAASSFPAATQVQRATNVEGQAACLEIRRGNRNSGAANQLSVYSIKPSTTYRVDVQVLAPIFGNWFRASLVTQHGGTTLVHTGTAEQIGVWQSWRVLTFTVSTPAWSSHPTAAYLVINSDHPSGSSRDFYLDNLDVYETGGRFLTRSALGLGVNPFGSGNAQGIYWINCGGNKLVVEQSRILGTLVVLNPGSGSELSASPVHLSPATAGYPSLIVNGDLTIRATDLGLSEAECATNFNPAGLPYEFNSAFSAATDSGTGGINDIYPSEVQGLVAVSGNLTYENFPRVRGQTIVGGSISGTPSFEHRPDSFHNPPPSFVGPYLYDRRPSSVRKAVLP